MPLRYYTRETDPSEAVYEVDDVAGTWRIVGSDPGSNTGRGTLIDGGKAFESVFFCRLEVVRSDEDGMTFLRPGGMIH